MNRVSSVLTGAAVGLVFGGAALLSLLWQRERELQNKYAQVQAEFAANRRLAATLQVATSSVTTAKVASQPGSRLPATTASSSVANNAARGTQLVKTLREMPEYAPFYHRLLRRRTMREYGELFAQMKLSPDRLEIVKAAIEDRIGTLQDAFETALEHGYSMATPAFEQQIIRYNEEANERLRGILEPDEYAQFDRFEKSAAWQRGTLLELEDYLGERGAPALTADHKRALIDAYVETLAWKPANDTPLPGPRFRMRNVQLGTLAAPALDPAQRTALLAYIDFINSREQVMAQLFRPKDPDGVVMGSNYQRR